MDYNKTAYKFLSNVFPEVIMQYFTIEGWKEEEGTLHVWLDERDFLERADRKSQTVLPHGFTDEKVIQDFPLRGKPVYLHVRKRRWFDRQTGETFTYCYDELTAEGTKITPEFVAFLKGED